MTKVITSYRDYAPAVEVEGAVELLLGYVPSEYLAGLRSVVLTNTASCRRLRRGKTWSRGRKVALAECLGLYKGDHIELLVDKILEGQPEWFVRWRFTRTLLIGTVLYHEIGHHIHRTRRPEHRETENIADEWQRRLLKGFVAKRYWYCAPIWRPVRWCIRRLYTHSIRDHLNGDHDTAVA
jgi:hypothetical protein